jgi:hypothetical protein
VLIKLEVLPVASSRSEGVFDIFVADEVGYNGNNDLHVSA